MNWRWRIPCASVARPWTARTKPLPAPVRLRLPGLWWAGETWPHKQKVIA